MISMSKAFNLFKKINGLLSTQHELYIEYMQNIDVEFQNSRDFRQCRSWFDVIAAYLSPFIHFRKWPLIYTFLLYFNCTRPLSKYKGFSASSNNLGVPPVKSLFPSPKMTGIMEMMHSSMRLRSSKSFITSPPPSQYMSLPFFIRIEVISSPMSPR